MAINWNAKDPDEVLDFTWEPALDVGDTISTYTVSVASGSSVIDSDTKTDSAVTIWISSGTDGETNAILARAVTSGGRTIEETIYLPIKASANVLISTLRRRYPAFAAVSGDIIGYWLTDAERNVGTDWIADDIGPAKMALAAHNMALQAMGDGVLPAGVTKFKSASFEATIADSVASGKGYQATVYGREYYQILRRNKAGPRLVVSA